MCLLFVSFLFGASISELPLKIRLQFKTNELKNKKNPLRKKINLFGGVLGEGQPFKNTAKPSFDVRYFIKSRSSGLSCKTTRLKTQSTSGCILPRTTKSSSADKWQLRSWIKGGICLSPKEKHSWIGGAFWSLCAAFILDLREGGSASHFHSF